MWKDRSAANIGKCSQRQLAASSRQQAARSKQRAARGKAASNSQQQTGSRQQQQQAAAISSCSTSQRHPAAASQQPARTKMRNKTKNSYKQFEACHKQMKSKSCFPFSSVQVLGPSWDVSRTQVEPSRTKNQSKKGCKITGTKAS